ncbi:MAG: hypothetical protein ACI9G1_003094 [Pirellulaceae bacterium]|jgi:hypothetical protein
MFTLFGDDHSDDCSGLNRRDFLRIGSMGLGGLSLPAILAARADAGLKSYVRDKSVVLLFCCGGPSHIEMFDPHMDRPSPQRSVTGETKTRLTGVSFGGTLKNMAARADRMAVVRREST